MLLRFHNSLGPFAFAALSCAMLAPAAPLDAKREFLENLRQKPRVTESDFEFPFLLSSTAVKADFSVTETVDRLRAYLKKGALPFRGTYGKAGLPASKLSTETYQLPEVVLQGDQRAGILSCKVSKCKMKLNIEREKGIVQNATDKVAAFHGLIVERIRRYLTRKEIGGVEDRDRNEPYFKKMLLDIPFLGLKYPAVERFLQNDLWESKPGPNGLLDSFLRQEIVIIAPERLQPIWRIAEVFEWKQPSGWLFVQLNFYTDHYFDSSLRVFEVVPFEKKSWLILTDVIEVDELTESALVRMLYMGKMQQAVRVAEAEDIEKIL